MGLLWFQVLGEKRVGVEMGDEDEFGPRKRIKIRDLESVCRAEGTCFKLFQISWLFWFCWGSGCLNLCVERVNLKFESSDEDCMCFRIA